MPKEWCGRNCYAPGCMFELRRVMSSTVLVACAAASGCSCTSSRNGGAAPAPPASSSTPAEGDAADASSEPRAPPGCPVAGKGVALGTVTAPALVEASGLTASVLTPGVLWTNNDSGDSARIFALGTDAKLVAEVEVTGASAVDWEAIASGPFEGAPALYIGDIGDNTKTRSNVTIYVVREPSLDPPPKSVPVARRVDLTYEDGPHDAEALLVDPDDGTIAVVTKSVDGKSGVYVADLTRSVLELATTLEGLPLVTDGSVSKDGRFVALRTYGTAFVWKRAARGSLADALRGTRCPLALESEPQGEAIALAIDGGSYFTLSEKKNQPLWSFALSPAPSP